MAISPPMLMEHEIQLKLKTQEVTTTFSVKVYFLTIFLRSVKLIVSRRNTGRDCRCGLQGLTKQVRVALCLADNEVQLQIQGLLTFLFKPRLLFVLHNLCGVNMNGSIK